MCVLANIVRFMQKRDRQRKKGDDPIKTLIDTRYGGVGFYGLQNLSDKEKRRFHNTVWGMFNGNPDNLDILKEYNHMEAVMKRNLQNATYNYDKIKLIKTGWKIQVEINTLLDQIKALRRIFREGGPSTEKNQKELRKAQKALQELQEKQAALFKSSHNGLFIGTKNHALSPDYRRDHRA